ncbi:MAG: hypothetical protein OEW75_10110, partial [Cyclobacteriaceae bacterium]|nr:hypothetical protein [Cyclobacteriaceae bacterium]
FNTELNAQSQPETTYFTFDYMKVKPGKYADYVKTEAVWKKIHQAKIKAGMADGWSFYQVASPSGSNVEYDFVTVNVFRGNKQLAGFYEGEYFPKGWESLLTKEELELVNNTATTRSIVKSEVWYYVDGVFKEDWGKNSNIFVFNFMATKPGKSVAEHTKIEQDVWKPVHDARIKGDQMTGWGMYNMMMPYGTFRDYYCGTLDVYKNMEQFLTSEYGKYFTQVHPGKDVDEMFAKTGEVTEIKMTVLMIKLDGTDN